MNVLFISFDGMTDPLGRSQVLPYLCGLAKKGHKIHILSLEKTHRFKQNEETIKKIVVENNLEWTPLVYSDAGLRSKISNVKRVRETAVSFVKEKNIEIAHCRSYLSALVGEFLKNRMRIKFVFDMRGFWADERIDGGIWKKNNPVHWLMYRYFKRKERSFLRSADKIISLTNNAKTEILSWKGFSQLADKIQVIPCCADLVFFHPENISILEKEKIKSNLSIPENKKILLYIGSLGTWYLLPQMLELFKLLQEKENNKWHFLIVTGDDKNIVQRESENQKINGNSITVISSSREDVPVYISFADASVFFIKQAYSKKASSPTKLAELLAMNIPVIANSGIGDNDFLNQKYNFGSLINNFDYSNYSSAIEFLSSTPKSDLRKIATDYFSLTKGVDLYHQIYLELQ